MDRTFTTYDAFWEQYLREHADGRSRALHYIGTAVAIVLFVRFLANGSLWSLLLAVASGYIFASAGHFLIEKNRPAVFERPLWTLYSDFRMFGLFLSGRLPDHLRKAGVEP